MKKNLFYFILFIFITSSSCKGEIEKNNEDLKGIWRLETMQYKDVTGNLEFVSDANIKLVFTNNYISSWSNGYQIIGDDTTVFKYDLLADECNLMFDQSDIKHLPLCGIGRVQVYNFEKIDKKTIEFSAAIEWDNADSLTFFNTSYLYTKISDLPK